MEAGDSCFSPSSFVWVPEIHLSFPDLCDKHLHSSLLLSHPSCLFLPSPSFFSPRQSFNISGWPGTHHITRDNRELPLPLALGRSRQILFTPFWAWDPELPVHRLSTLSKAAQSSLACFYLHFKVIVPMARRKIPTVIITPSPSSKQKSKDGSKKPNLKVRLADYLCDGGQPAIGAGTPDRGHRLGDWRLCKHWGACCSSRK